MGILAYGYRPGYLSSRAPDQSCRGPRVYSLSSYVFSLYLYDHHSFPKSVDMLVVADYDFFEVQILDELGDDSSPLGIALASPCPQNLSPEASSNFKTDFVRFLATNEGT